MRFILNSRRFQDYKESRKNCLRGLRRTVKKYSSQMLSFEQGTYTLEDYFKKDTVQ
jgi:hypothetical protein